MAKFKASDVAAEAEHFDDPFEVEFDDGSTHVLVHPKAIPVDVLIDFDSLPTRKQMEALTGGDTSFFSQQVNGKPIDGFFMDRVVKMWAQHYGLDLPGEGGASPR
ncbi:MAG TPA: hypothetical protein VHB02_06015 [Acidimicrobiales bacterium]|nr:hypothetical protein [Acidimicrobiales bacterium]